jgi:predicted Fe-Mo cluster-binding NifX family protein
MKIEFTAIGTTWDSLIDPRFGRAAYIVLYNKESQEFSVFDNSAVKNEAHGAGTAMAQKMYELKPDVLITGNGPGGNAAGALKHLNMKIFIDAQGMTLREAFENYKNGKLREL